MENIIILPTDKPSRLFYNVGGALLFTSFSNYNGVNMYVTSNEHIKYNDFITDGYNVWQWKDDSSLLGRKKIILTTDKMLVDDGVEQLTDDFLTWFTKHQDCTDLKINK